LAFNPPKKSYDLKRVESNDPRRGPSYKIVSLNKSVNKGILEDIPGIKSSAYWIYTKTGSRIPVLFFYNKASLSNFVILYSHGNATDLSLMRPYLLELSYTLNVHVFAYEYRGYGPTTGGPNDMEIIYDAMAAYDELTKRMYFNWYQIILYGRSIGSGPTLYLASHPNYPVSGVILHSPIASGLRIFNFKVEKTNRNDLFPNSDLIEHVRAPVFIMHGEMDKEVAVRHGKLLSTKCKSLYNPWWVPEGGHDDLDLKFRRTYFLKLSRYLKSVKDKNIGKTDSNLYDLYKVEPWHENFDHIYVEKEKLIEENWKKIQKDIKIPKDYYPISNASFLTQSITSTTYRPNTGESLFTTTVGDQSARKTILDSARTIYECENGKEDNTVCKTDRSPIKEQSIIIDLSSSRHKPNILKDTVLEPGETPRIIDATFDEKDKNNHLEFGCKGDDPTPYEVSFDNSQFTTEIKSGPTDTNLEVVVEGKKNE